MAAKLGQGNQKKLLTQDRFSVATICESFRFVAVAVFDKSIPAEKKKKNNNNNSELCAV